MVKKENLAANFCSILASQGFKDKAVEWRVLGQERDGSLLLSWIFINTFSKLQNTCIGHYTDKSFHVLYKFTTKCNIIQASVNNAVTLVAYVVKYSVESESLPSENIEIVQSKFIYQPFVVEIKNVPTKPTELMSKGSRTQVMVQFLWKIDSSGSIAEDKLLLLIHKEVIYLYTFNAKSKCESCHGLSNSLHKKNDDDMSILNTDLFPRDIIVKHFTWAQWDSENQTLFYIHLKQKSSHTFSKEDFNDFGTDFCSTLSALQFNIKFPTETVLNIPLNLPKIPSKTHDDSSVYEDDTVPMRIHDSSLNLIILTDISGMLLVCHHYLYQLNNPPIGDTPAENLEVHFAYSVTLLHHGCVIHCVMPGIPFEKAKMLKPTFAMYGDHHLLVFQPDLFVHLLDVGSTHEPCCHIICPAYNKKFLTHLVHCRKWGQLAYDITTLEVVSLSIPKAHLIDTFRNDNSIDNRLSIVHYFLVHTDDIDVLTELISCIMEKPLSLNTVALLKEALIAGSYSITTKGLSSEALSLMRLLPITTSIISKPTRAKVMGINVGLSHENLWNTTMMLLSPQQRLSPYKIDFWTNLWYTLSENIQKQKKRFAAEQVSEKLMFSLACYQPEALSKCSTPISPNCNAINLISNFSSRIRQIYNEDLPFVEIQTCTATKQEHIISVNLRELSVHLVKHSVKQKSGFRWLKETLFERSQAPTFVHSVASEYSAAQLEMSRALCILVCRAAGLDTRHEKTKSFQLVDQMASEQLYSLFIILQRYCLAIDSTAFPLPQGFSSFFTYLGYRTLSFETFVQYIENHVFELQVDVMKAIISDIDDSEEGIEKKLLLMSFQPNTRAHRLLKGWDDPKSFMIRSRECAEKILSGNCIQILGVSEQKNKKLKPSSDCSDIPEDNFSPLIFFLDLLTAKANFNDLEFKLLVKATTISMTLQIFE